MEMIIFDKITEKIIELRGSHVILDSDVAELYGVETKRVNEAVKNNKERFPDGYIIETTLEELEDLRSKISTAKLSKTRTPPKAFTEKGLYMLATILTSKQAIATSIDIIETFQKIRNLGRIIKQLPDAKSEQEQQSLMQKGGDIIAEVLDDAFDADESETTVELNFAVMKFKHTRKKKK